LEEGSRSPYSPLFSLLGALLVGGVLASGLEVLGFHLRGRLSERFGLLDGLGGAVLVACLGLALAWVVGAVALQTPGARELRQPIQRSAILSRLNAALPPSGPLLNALARFDPFPRIDGPAADVRPPNSAVARDAQVRAAGASVVRVLGTACGLGVQGSGWVAGDGLVVTNAHVVAGQDDTAVQIAGEGPEHDADAIFFDVKNDLAILRSSGVSGAPALPLDVGAPPGTSAAILGFPENGPYDVRPARLGQTETVLSQDAYGRGPVERPITSVRGRVRSGNSGGPVVDTQGEVVTTIFAATVGSGRPSGYGVPDTVVRDALRRAEGPVDTGPCAR
jgi:S1-C subfamily serine protease